MTTEVIEPGIREDRGGARAEPVRARRGGVWSLPEVRWAALATVGVAPHFHTLFDRKHVPIQSLMVQLRRCGLAM
jgi:hypothetical protein